MWSVIEILGVLADIWLSAPTDHSHKMVMIIESPILASLLAAARRRIYLLMPMPVI